MANYLGRRRGKCNANRSIRAEEQRQAENGRGRDGKQLRLDATTLCRSAKGGKKASKRETKKLRYRRITGALQRTEGKKERDCAPMKRRGKTARQKTVETSRPQPRRGNYLYKGVHRYNGIAPAIILSLVARVFSLCSRGEKRDANREQLNNFAAKLTYLGGSLFNMRSRSVW